MIQNDNVVWDKSLCIPPVKFEIYDKPDIDWIDKEVKLKDSYEDEPNRVISGFEKINGIWNVLFKDNYCCRDLEECFKTMTWADGSVFGQEV